MFAEAGRTTAILRASVAVPGAVPTGVVGAVMAVILAGLILWMIVVPRPDRSGTVLATRMRPAHHEIGPVFNPVLKMVEFQAADDPVSWTLVVRRPDGHTMTVRVRHQVYDRCHVGDWYDSARESCRP